MAPRTPPFLDAIRDALAGAPIERARARWSAAPAQPWHAWLVLALARQVSRQRWLVRIWRGPLANARRRRDEDDRVPGLPGWRFHFHGKGLCLTGPDGEMIDVDDHGDEGLTIDPYFFAARIASLPDPALPELRLRTWLPTGPVIADAIEQLAAAGLVTPGHTFRIDRSLEDAAEDLAAVDFTSISTCVRWAEHMGDHFLDEDRAPAQREAYRRYLFTGLARAPSDYIEPLAAVLSPAEFVEACSQLVDGPMVHPAGRAIECLEQRPEAPFCDAVTRLLRRADPARDHPYAVYQAARYLLRRGVERELAGRVALAFAEVEVVTGFRGNPYLDELALLLLEHDPRHGLTHIRRALRSTTPMVRHKAAAALAVLDQPWCHREMLRALEEATTFEDSALLRQALLHSGAPEARAAVEAWLRTHVARVSAGPGYTFEEVLEANAGGWFAREVDGLRPWAEAVRPRLDPDLDRVVWA